MSTRHKYDFSWGEGSPVGGIRNVFNMHKYGSPCALRGCIQVISVPSYIAICISGSWLGMEFGIVGLAGDLILYLAVSVKWCRDTMSLALAGEFMWIPYLWSHLTAINYLGVHPNLDTYR
jgi:hypothetical protein